MSEEPKPALARLVALLRGDPDGGPLRRAQYYAFNAIAGGIVGFLIVAMATPSREHRGDGFSLDIYLYGIAAGAVAAVLIVTVPRLLHPRDWPTRDEFRRGAPRKKDQG
ncbi:MAG: hypothetical protein KIT16_06195 [Rhodospirillaceae bacterium]|nr:hypothetical protein [Rhodospirillaceae bacterium]